MGFEHDRYPKPCGCIEHDEYEEVCGMGAIPGTRREWIEKCTHHGGYLPTKVEQTSAVVALKEKRAELQKQKSELEARLAQIDAELLRAEKAQRMA